MHHYLGKTVIKVPLFKTITIKRHKKKRIDKKLNKKYGIKTELIQIRPRAIDIYVAFDKILIPEEIYDDFIKLIK